MVAQPYKNVTFSTNSPLDKDTLNQMANNSQWLFENLPKVTYAATGIKRSAGMKILAGVTPYQPTPWEHTGVVVNFSNFFTPGCQVVVVANNVSGYTNRKYASLRALDETEFIDHRGFIAAIGTYEHFFDPTAPKTINRPGFLSWIAVGF